MITDTRLLKVDVFYEFLVAINESIRSEHARFNHPNFMGSIMVTTAGLMKLSMKELDSEAFGHIINQVFDTMNEALAHAHALIAQEKEQK